MAAQLEEIIFNANALALQYLLPHLNQLLLHRRARSLVGIAFGIALRRRQRRAIHLAVGRQWQLLDDHPLGRAHVRRQMTLDVLAQWRRIRILGSHIRHQLLVAGMILAHHHDGLLHARMRQQRCFNFAQLDAIAAQLYLVIDAPDEFQLPVRAIAHPVTRSVQPCSAAEWIGDEAFSR
ncbi:MAG: hypothetical protein WC617_17005 [Rhodanobacter sp.]